MTALRGQKLDNTLFHDTIVMALPVPERKGRSEQGLEENNKLLITRYVYYKLFHRHLRYDYIIEEKIRPVVGYLATYTIAKKISLLDTEIQQLKNINPSKQWFKSQYPAIVWD